MYKNLKNNQPITVTSLTVAEYAGKRHGNVLQTIRKLLKVDSGLSQEFAEANYAADEYLDSRGRRQPMYDMTKKGLLALCLSRRGPAAVHGIESIVESLDAVSKCLGDVQRETAIEISKPAPRKKLIRIFEIVPREGREENRHE